MMALPLTKHKLLKAVITACGLAVFLNSLSLNSLAYANYDDYEDYGKYNVIPAWHPGLDFQPPAKNNNVLVNYGELAISLTSPGPSDTGDSSDNKIIMPLPEQFLSDKLPEPPEPPPPDDQKLKSLLGLDKDAELTIEILIGALKSGNYDVSQKAQDALVKRGSSAVEPLIKALGDKDPYFRFFAAIILGRIEDPHSVEPLIKALGDEDPYVRQAAAIALGQIGAPRAVEPLIKALRDEDINVNQRAQDALVKIGQPAVEPLIKALNNKDFLNITVKEALVRIGEPAVALLIKAFSDKDPYLRLAVADTLGEIGQPAVEPLIKALGDENLYVRQAAALALGKIGDPQAEGPLIKALSDKESYVRQAAAIALGQIGGLYTPEPLFKALSDEDPYVRQAVAYILVEIGDPRAVKPLIKAYGNSNIVTQDAIELVFVKQMESLQKIIDTESDPLMRQNAENIINKLEARSLLIKDIKDTYKVTIGDDKPFSARELQSISLVLAVLSPEYVEGLTIVKKDVEPGLEGEYFQEEKKIGLKNMFTPERQNVLFHEITHHIDYKYFDFKAFDNLYIQSKKSGDFARDYGRKNSREDFATTVEMYASNPGKEFLRGIKQTEAGNPVYLEKLLFVLDVFTRGHPDYTMVYKIEESGIIKQSFLPVSRDASGKINAIGEVSIKDYNRLKELFSNLK